MVWLRAALSCVSIYAYVNNICSVHISNNHIPSHHGCAGVARTHAHPSKSLGKNLWRNKFVLFPHIFTKTKRTHSLVQFLIFRWFWLHSMPFGFGVPFEKCNHYHFYVYFLNHNIFTGANILQSLTTEQTQIWHMTQFRRKGFQTFSVFFR